MLKVQMAMTVFSLSASLTATHPAQAQGVSGGAKSSRLAPEMNYGKLPLSFEANQGQAEAGVRFTSSGQGYSLFLTDKEAVLALSRGGEDRSVHAPHDPFKPGAGLSGGRTSLKTDIVRMQLAGAAPGLKVSSEDKLPGTANYFIGNDPAKWHSNVPTYAKVKYAGVYPGVDLVYYGNQRQLEYDFVVAPGADPKQVKLHFAGAEKLKLTPEGDLEIMARNGEVAFHKPVVYQVRAGQRAGESASQREPVEGKFVLLAGNTVRFRVGSYDKSQELVIDPTLAYSTYLGSGGTDGSDSSSAAAAIAVDASGSAYITGQTNDPTFPVTAGAYRSANTNASGQPFVVKLNSTGTLAVYSTYFGGSGDPSSDATDTATAIAVDSSGNAYITGFTPSSDFPTTAGAYQRKPKNPDDSGFAVPFVTKLNASGTALVYSTYLSGSGDVDENGAESDGATGIAVDAAGHAYITGQTWSPDFPTTPGAFQTTNNALPNETANGFQRSNAFVTEMNTSGSGLVYSTLLGGSGGPDPNVDDENGDGGNAIAVDKLGDAYVTGFASSTDFPLSGNAYQKENRAVNLDAGTYSSNAFVSEISPTGSSLVYSTYLGGTGRLNSFGIIVGDEGFGIALDPANNVYVAGQASSTNFPISSGAFQITNKSTNSTIYASNAFVSKLNPASGQLVYSTYLGGNSGEYATSIAIDSSGDAYLTGYAFSSSFPVTQNALPGPGYAFATEFNPGGTALVYSTLLKATMGGVGIALDPIGNFYVAGSAYKGLPTTPGAYLGTSKTFSNPFVVKFAQGADASTTSVAISPASATVGQTVTLTATVGAGQGASGTPTGTVAFYNGSTQLGTATLESNGTATLTTSSLAAGTYSITAAYSGDGVFQQSLSSAESLTVSAESVATTTSLTASTATIASGSSVTLAATVAGPLGSTLMPTGTVTFLLNGTTVLGTGALNTSAMATLTTTALPVGSDSITARYGGDTNYEPSTSSARAISVTSAAPGAALQFIPVTPCRVADTRLADGPFGGPALDAGASREFAVPLSGCNIPSTAVAYSLNATVVPNGKLGYLTLWPSGQPQPITSTLNSDGRVKANAAIVPAGANGGVSVFATNSTHFILDIDGYFVPAGTASALAFYPVTPCRVADTRDAAGPLGGPFILGGASRSFPVQSSSCGLPSAAQAYSLNITAVPDGALGYLTTWPTGQSQPIVSTLNAPTGEVTANAAIVPAGAGGDISVFVSNSANVVVDVNGYFAAPAANGLSLYATTPCRVLDTRTKSEAFSGVLPVPVESSPCALPSTAQSYVLNATAIPEGALGFLTLWPQGEDKPAVSTLNATDGATTSNMAIVPNANGNLDAYATNKTNLILDISSYFAP